MRKLWSALGPGILLAFVPIFPGPEAWRHLVVPALPPGSIVLAAAILSWMPTGIDVSVWHSLWTVEKQRACGAAPLLYALNLYCVTRQIDDPGLRPARRTVGVACAGILFMLVALGTTVYVKLGSV